MMTGPSPRLFTALRLGTLLVAALALTGCEEDSCFAAGTVIATPEGNVPIERIAVGDLVYGYDLDRGEPVPARVVRRFVHEDRPVRRLTTSDGRSVRVTDEHPFYVEGAWVPAGELEPGATLTTLDDAAATRTTVATNRREPERVTVYNLEVEGHHDYFAAGVLVHNKSPAERDRDMDGVGEFSDCDDTDPTITTECRDDAGP